MWPQKNSNLFLEILPNFFQKKGKYSLYKMGWLKGPFLVHYLSCVLFIISLNCLSTAKNALLSLGSWRWISGALKMLSKYIHCFWHSHHWSNTLPKCFNMPSSFSTSFRIPATYLLHLMSPKLPMRIPIC